MSLSYWVATNDITVYIIITHTTRRYDLGSNLIRLLNKIYTNELRGEYILNNNMATRDVNGGIEPISGQIIGQLLCLGTGVNRLKMTLDIDKAF